MPARRAGKHRNIPIFQFHAFTHSRIHTFTHSRIHTFTHSHIHASTMKKTIIILLLFLPLFITAQTGTITGTVSSEGERLEFVNVILEGTELGTITDSLGGFRFEKVPLGEYLLTFSFTGYEALKKEVGLSSTEPSVQVDIEMKESPLLLDQIVVTGTRTFKRQTQSPVIVNVIDQKMLDNVQACNLSEGLRFQPGLRVETDCQTCNYTQLRMNGLGGGYSQILINGRPIFSPLTGLYGMEQIPANMIDRIEVVRGGGSALYGSSAIGGTVNIITRIPRENAFNVSYMHQSINHDASDNLINANATVLSPKGNAGASFFLSNRNRALYDHNGDNFSELPELRNNSFGANLFFQPTKDQKLELSLSSLREYRYGGEMVDQPAHLTQQSEERNHDVLMGNLDYQINFNNGNSSLITYLAAQHTQRDHYTGIFPDDSLEIEQHLVAPPYGISENTTFQAGVQLNHRFLNFPLGSNVFTLGTEYIYDDVLDRIDPYSYLIDQQTLNLGAFLQSDWEITPELNLLTGIRADKHNLVDRLIFSPRVSLLYKLKNTTQFRLSWSTGFRAPQAFDADLHLAFAGGGVSRISLSPDLREERSNSFSASVNYDKATENFIVGFTFEGFYTYLKDAFFQQPLGTDSFGERFEKQNGDGATVQGLTVEVRANYDRKVQLEAGFTLQSSLFDEPVDNIEGLEPRREFLRTPNEYGYATLTFNTSERWNTALNLVYTGPMVLAHFAGAPGQEVDEYVTSRPFTELSLKTAYRIPFQKLGTSLELFGGLRNLTNAYQDDFDIGKNRDSNFVYGPALPRTIFIGLKLASL
jgi:outer membrane receptor for ferrienterochelin and colicins